MQGTKLDWAAEPWTRMAGFAQPGSVLPPGLQFLMQSDVIITKVDGHEDIYCQFFAWTKATDQVYAGTDFPEGRGTNATVSSHLVEVCFPVLS